MWTGDIMGEMNNMQEEIDYIFKNVFGRPSSRYFLTGPGRDMIKSSYRQPSADVWETDKEIKAAIEIPGVDKKDIQLNITEESIEVKAEKKHEFEQEDKNKGTYRYEREYAGFCRAIPLPKNVDASKAEAEYKNGILKISIPKLELKDSRKQIPIK